MKIYLNGMDHAAAGLGAACRFTPGRSNHFILVTEFDHAPEPDAVAALCRSLPSPVAALFSGHSRRGWDLAPCWVPGEAAEIPCNTVDGPSREELLENFADLPLPPRRGLALRVGRLAGGGALLMWKFSHRLLDGAGAELIVAAALSGEWPEYAPPGMADSALHHWGDKMRSGKMVNRALLAVRRAGPLMHLAPPPMRRGGVRCFLHSFDLEQVRANAEREAGPLMLGCYTMAVTARTVAGFLLRRGVEPGILVMPVSLDLRKRGAARPELFFNRWGVLPLSWDVRTLHSRADWILRTKLQTAAMVGDGLPGDFAAAQLLTRILPVRTMAQLSQRCFHGRAGSFMFSLLAPSKIPERALGAAITDFYHLPAMPPDPAFGLFLNCRGGKLNLTASWRDGALERGDMAELAAELTSALEET